MPIIRLGIADGCKYNRILQLLFVAVLIIYQVNMSTENLSNVHTFATLDSSNTTSLAMPQVLKIEELARSRLMASINNVVPLSFHNMDPEGKSFGHAFKNNIQTALQGLKGLSPNDLGIPEGQQLVVLIAQKLFNERAFDIKDMVPIQEILQKVVNGAVLSGEEIIKLWKVTTATLKERFSSPPQLAVLFSNGVIGRDDLELRMNPSYDWQKGVIVSGVQGGLSLDMRDLEGGFNGYPEGYGNPFFQNTVDEKKAKDAVNDVIKLLEQVGVERAKKDQEEGRIDSSYLPRLREAIGVIEACMERFKADGVVVDTSLLRFTTPGSLASYKSRAELLVLAKAFRAMLEGADIADVDDHDVVVRRDDGSGGGIWGDYIPVKSSV
jgi:hypothetical protein